jgi:polyphosphate glucokinase
MKKVVDKRASPKTILIVDIGGSHVKAITNTDCERRAFTSGPHLTAKTMMKKLKRLTADWSYDVVSVGFPGSVVCNRPLANPFNLGGGWKGFDFEKAFGRPTKVVNDALMQALGAYDDGKMLFLGFGTGLGSAMIVDGVLAPMELGHLPYRKEETFEYFVGEAGLKRHGKKKWRGHVLGVIKRLTTALEPDYVVVGGGNADKIGRLPSRARLGCNGDAFLGGVRLWRPRATRDPRLEHPVTERS